MPRRGGISSGELFWWGLVVEVVLMVALTLVE
jgi:hypothetical protein